MQPKEFNILVDEHARAWKKVGFSSSGIIYDPNARYDLEEACEQSRKLVDKIERLQADLKRVQTEPPPAGLPADFDKILGNLSWLENHSGEHYQLAADASNLLVGLKNQIRLLQSQLADALCAEDNTNKMLAEALRQLGD